VLPLIGRVLGVALDELDVLVDKSIHCHLPGATRIMVDIADKALSAAVKRSVV
jgi:hypothetical protein